MRSSFKVSAARARAGSMVLVYSSRNAWTPAAVSGRFLPQMRFTSPTQVLESNSVTATGLLLGWLETENVVSIRPAPTRGTNWKSETVEAFPLGLTNAYLVLSICELGNSHGIRPTRCREINSLL